MCLRLSNVDVYVLYVCVCVCIYIYVSYVFSMFDCLRMLTACFGNVLKCFREVKMGLKLRKTQCCKSRMIGENWKVHE